MHFITSTFLAALISLICLQAHAREKTIWACRTTNPTAEPIIWLVEQGTRSYVKFSHMRFSAFYQVEDEQQGWYWHNDGSGFYRYGLVLDSDGSTWYYDFAQGESQTLDQFFCKSNA